MSAGHYENFPVASFLVPRRERRAILALYRYARAADDLADEGDAPPQARLDALARFRAAVDAIAAGRDDDPRLAEAPFPDLLRAVREHRLPTAPLADLLSAFAQDVTVHRYADYAALRRLLPALGRPGRPARARACTAGATTPSSRCPTRSAPGSSSRTSARTSPIDWRKDRVYLPQDEMARHGVTERADRRRALRRRRGAR